MRHVVVRKGDDWKQARLVYDYQGYICSFILTNTRNLGLETDSASTELLRKMTMTMTMVWPTELNSRLTLRFMTVLGQPGETLEHLVLDIGSAVLAKGKRVDQESCVVGILQTESGPQKR